MNALVDRLLDRQPMMRYHLEDLSVQLRNPNPHNLPMSAALRMTELTVPPSFEELSKAMLNLGSMVQSAWLQAQVPTSTHK